MCCTWLILTLNLPGYAHVGAGAHEGTSAPLELELQEVVSQLTWELGRELKSLQEREALFTAEPSFQSLVLYFL